MQSPFGKLKTALGIGGLFSFYGIVAIATMAFPYPRITYMQRTLILVAIFLVTLPFFLLIGFVMSRRAKKKAAAAADEKGEATEAASSDDKPANLKAPTGTYGELSVGAEEAVQFLKTSNLAATGKDAVYGLPWYLVAGAPRAGKSSLVISSNLNFQTLPSQRQSEQKFVRPTPNIDWRVTSEAVFIDSAGRYQTEGLDADEWTALLETLKKYRANRPIDGLLLVVNAEQILKADDRELEEIAKVQRNRLDEVMQRLKVRFPVYLVFSHADAIEGFRDSFSTSKSEDKTLVWGSTIPIEKADNGQALFDAEYGILQDSVSKRRIARLSAPFPPVRQLKIFNFPLHFGTGRKKFGTFINALFRPNPFSENPFLRGFYFTASPAAKAGANGQQTVANSYFTERFFRDVVLRDKDMVSTFVAQKQGTPIFGWLLTLLITGITFLLLLMSGISLLSNNKMLTEAEEVGGRMLTVIKGDNRPPLEKSEGEAKKEIGATEDLRGFLVRLDDNDREGPPIYMRFGMYSGTKVYTENLLPIYMSVIEQRYKKPMVARLESDLRKFADSQPVANAAQLTEKEEEVLSKNYDLLKAYLMLSGKFRDKAESGHLSTTLKDIWVVDSKTPPELKLVAQQQLEFWAKQVDRDQFARVPLNDKLVEDTRRKLQAFPAKYRYLSRMVSEISKEVDEANGFKNSPEGILTKYGGDTNFIEGTYTVPGAYTWPGLTKMKLAIAEASIKLSEPDWVMGEDAGKSLTAGATDAADIESRYYRDYAVHWRNFMRNTRVKQYKNNADATQAMLLFSSSNSPIEILAREVSKNTNLSVDPGGEGWFDWIKKKLFRTKSAGPGNSEPEKEFRPLFKFVGTDEEGEKAGINQYKTQLGNIYKAIDGKSDDAMKEAGAEMAKDNDVLKLRPRETAINTLLAPFNATPSGQDVGIFLQEPVNRLRELIGAGQKDQLAKSWSQEIVPAAKEIEKGFPFEDGQAESDLTKLTAFLNPTDGKLSVFYKEKLETYFEEADGKLKVKENSSVQFTDEFVAYLNNAFALRRALFGNNPTPKFEYEFSIKSGSGATVEIVIDGQKVDTTGTGSIKGTFPAGGSVETGVRISQIGDTAATAPASTNSNTSAPSPSSSPTQPGQQVFAGNWGLFRFVDAGNPQKQPGGEYSLTYNVGGKPISATIKPNGGDPFDKSLFRNVKAPETVIK